MADAGRCSLVIYAGATLVEMAYLCLFGPFVGDLLYSNRIAGHVGFGYRDW